MDQSEKFSDYLFAKMGPPHATNGDAECPRKTTDSCEAPVELTGIRRWLSDNLMLLLTLSGVLFGIIAGKFPFFFFCHVLMGVRTFQTCLCLCILCVCVQMVCT